MLFRQASKKLLTQIHNNKTQDRTTPAATPPHCAALQPLPSLGDKEVLVNRAKPGLQEIVCLSPLAEEQGAGLTVQEGAGREGLPQPAKTLIKRKKSPGHVSESFEMEEASQTPTVHQRQH